MNDNLDFEKRLEIASKNIHRREIQLDINSEVAMANDMILHSASNLNLVEMKLLRFIIMQTKKGDEEFYEFEISMNDIANTLEMNVDYLYREMDDMTTHIMQEVIFIGDGSNRQWIKFHWVDTCRYEDGKITIKISDELKPFLIGLRGSFTRYALSEITSMNSIYAIRIYEILNGYMNDNNLPHADVGIEISISIDTIRKATDTVNSYQRYSSFKTYVIDNAVKEINRCSKYHVTATPYKHGRSVAGFDFLIESQAGYAHRMGEFKNETYRKKPKAKTDPDYKQLTMSEFFVT